MRNLKISHRFKPSRLPTVLCLFYWGGEHRCRLWGFGFKEVGLGLHSDSAKYQLCELEEVT